MNSRLAKTEAELRAAQEAKREAKARVWRLKAQRQKLFEEQGRLAAREMRNIEELEVDEALAQLEPLPSSPIGFSQVSFGSLGRTSLVPTGRS